MDSILLMDMIYSTMEGIVPSRCRLTTQHLGATLFKLRLHQMCKSHLTASMHHGTWGLMQSHFYWPYWRPDSSHHNESALGGYKLLLSTIQVPAHYLHKWPGPWGLHWLKFLWASGNYKSQVAASMTTRHLEATYVEYSVLTSDWDE